MDRRELEGNASGEGENGCNHEFSPSWTALTTGTLESPGTSVKSWFRSTPWPVLFAFLLVLLTPGALAMRPGRVAQLRRETVDMFYHGYNNYMRVAFPEDEVSSIPTHTASELLLSNSRY